MPNACKISVKYRSKTVIVRPILYYSTFVSFFMELGDTTAAPAMKNWLDIQEITLIICRVTKLGFYMTLVCWSIVPGGPLAHTVDCEAFGRQRRLGLSSPDFPFHVHFRYPSGGHRLICGFATVRGNACQRGAALTPWLSTYKESGSSFVRLRQIRILYYILYKIYSKFS